MQFNASLLKEQSLESANKLALENSVEERKNSFIYSMLEHNDIMHKLDIEEKINYYRTLVEASTGKCTDIALREGIIDSVHGFLTKVIQAIINLFNKFIGFIRGTANEAAYKEFESLSKEFDSVKYGADKNSPLEKNIDVIAHVYPKVSEVPERYFAASLNNLLDLLDRLINGNDVSKEAIASAKEMAYKTIAKAAISKRSKFTNPVVDRNSFLDHVKENCCYKENRYMKLADFLSEFRPYGECSKEITSKLASIKSVLEKAKSDLNTKSAAMDPENRTKANTIISHCEAISQDCITYFNMISTMNLQATIYWNKTYKSAKRSSVKESGTIHGEVFDSDTLFDNDDIRDFNRTEWLDLELATECYEISSAVYEYRRRVAANEAMIIAENGIDTFRKLVAMQEAEAKELGNKFMEILQTIIVAVDKFFSNLRDKLSLDANFIKKNIDTIKKPIKLTNIKSSGDILNGLKNIQGKLNITPYSYDTMKDDLSNEKEFFYKRIKPSLNGGKHPRINWNDTNMTVAEYCKAYYGASIPEDKAAKVDISAADLQANIADIISFLEAPNALMANIRAELTTLKSQANRAASDAKADQTNSVDKPTEGVPEKTSASETSETKQESMYYSELYQRWFTEADFQAPASEGGSETSGNAEGGSKSDSKSGFKTYIQAYRSVLLAKLTGAQFVRSELMALMKAHVKVYNPKAGKDEKKEAPVQQETPAQENNT